MNILVTGAKGFAGRNIVENLKCFRDGKNKTRPNLQIEEIYEYDLENTPEDPLFSGDCVKRRIALIEANGKFGKTRGF